MGDTAQNAVPVRFIDTSLSTPANCCALPFAALFLQACSVWQANLHATGVTIFYKMPLWGARPGRNRQ